jgi:hypothetical protein
MRYFGKSRRGPTDEERRRLARIVNPNQRRALLAAIQRGETIPGYAWTPFPKGKEENPKLLEFHEQLLKYAESSGRDMMEVVASLRPESHVQFYAARAKETTTEDTGCLCGTPLPVPDLVDDAEQATGLLCWGLFNPWEPTLSFLALIGVPEHPESLLYLTQMNPFQYQNLVFGVIPDSIRDSYLDDILDEVLSKYSTGEFGLFSDSLPSFIVPLSRVKIRDLVRKGLAHVGSEVVERESALLRRIPCDPWAMATELYSIVAQMRRARTKTQGQHKTVPIQQASAKSLDDWLFLASFDFHVNSFFDQLPYAWRGAIEHSPTRDSVMVWEDAERVLRKLFPEVAGRY